MSKASSLSIQIKKQRQSFAVDVDLAIKNQGVTAVFGPSGCGKTTLLRCIAGLDCPDSGEITFGAEPWIDSKQNLPTEKRQVAVVFQQSQLFKHVNVEQNIKFSHRFNPLLDDDALFSEIVQLLEIEHVLESYPQDISGGEKQRVAIARAIVQKPKILLMDEPLASLDVVRKSKVLGYLQKIKTSFELPIVYVSHSLEEVAQLADDLIVMESGQVKQFGPVNEIMAELPHLMQHMQQGELETFSVWFGRVIESQHPWLECIQCGDLVLNVPVSKSLAQSKPQTRLAKNEIDQRRVRLYAKDVSIVLEKPINTSILNCFAMKVCAINLSEDDGQATINLEVGQQQLISKISLYSLEQLKLQIGQQVYAQVKAVSILT